MLRPFVCTIVLAAACGSGLPPPAAIQRNVALHAVKGCPAVETAVQDAAVTEMRARLESRAGRGAGARPSAAA